jgi:hypothetical protein
LEAHFRLFLAAIEGVTMENPIDLQLLSSEFQFVELGRQVAEFISQHPHVEIIRLKSATADLQRHRLTDAVVRLLAHLDFSASSSPFLASCAAESSHRRVSILHIHRPVLYSRCRPDDQLTISVPI